MEARLSQSPRQAERSPLEPIRCPAPKGATGTMLLANKNGGGPDGPTPRFLLIRN